MPLQSVNVAFSVTVSFTCEQCMRQQRTAEHKIEICPCLAAVECAQIAERLRKAVGKAAQGEPVQGQAAAVLGQQVAPAKAPGYEADAEMQ